MVFSCIESVCDRFVASVHNLSYQILHSMMSLLLLVVTSHYQTLLQCNVASKSKEKRLVANKCNF